MATASTEVKGNGRNAEIVRGPDVPEWWREVEETREAIREVYAPKATDTQFLVFLAECKRRRAYPGRHIHFRLQRQKEKVYDPDMRQQVEQWTEKPIFITSIDFFRLTAHRTGKYAGQKPLAWYYLDTSKKPTVRMEKVPDPSMEPYAAEATVLRSDFQEPLVRTARWAAYVQTYKKKDDEDDEKRIPNTMWRKMGPEMIAKCAEAQALRAAFPEELGGLYISEEIPDDQPAESAPISTGAALQPVPAPTLLPPIPPEPAKVVSEAAVNREPGVSAPQFVLDPPKLDLGPTESQPKAAGVSPEEVAKRFGGEVVVESKLTGRERAKNFLREVLASTGMKNSGEKLKRYLLASANRQKVEEITPEQWTAIMDVLEIATRQGGPDAAVRLIEAKAAGERGKK